MRKIFLLRRNVIAPIECAWGGFGFHYRMIFSSLKNEMVNYPMDFFSPHNANIKYISDDVGTYIGMYLAHKLEHSKSGGKKHANK